MAPIVATKGSWRSESGAELIEFALTFPLLLLVVFGIVDFGLLFQKYEVVTNAAREGARIAVLPDYQASALASAQARVEQYLSAANLKDAHPPATLDFVTLDLGAGLPQACGYKVTVTYPHNFFYVGGIASYFGASFGTSSVTSASTMRVEGPPGPCP